MKNLRNYISSTNRNNLRLFIAISIIVLIAITGLLVWQTTAQMQTTEQFSANGVPTPTPLNLTVTRNDDRNATCVTGDCSLREAINAADASSGNDTINFASNLTTINLTGSLFINNTGTLTINGLGANVLTINGNGNRIFFTTDATVSISGLTLTGGTGIGAAIFARRGSLMLDRMNITGNQALIDHNGGGVFYENGTHKISNSTFSANTAFNGGGIFNSGGTLTIVNSTFSGNTANRDGGGFCCSNVTFRNVTITNNTASWGGGISAGGMVDFGNTIVAGNTATSGRGPDFSTFGTAPISAGGNLVGDSSGDSTNIGNRIDNGVPINYQPTDIRDVNPLFGTLQNNGGTTPTFALLTGSPAIDSGLNTLAVDPNGNTPLSFDQRGTGFTRIADGNNDNTATVDIGAFEVQTMPTLGNYPNTTVTLGANTTITPDAVPTNTISINVSTDINFNGTFAANPITGIVRVTNAHPAGTYAVTVKAFNNASGMTTRTFTLTVGNGTVCNGAIQFTNAPNVSIGSNTRNVAIGDFNNDGIQDIALTSFNLNLDGQFSNNMVVIRLGNGAGGFSGTTNISVGPGPTDVAIGDFNNDGNQDFITANIISGVSVRLGNGLGGFSGSTDISLNGQPGRIELGDFNNDGNQDFAVVKGFSDTVSVRLGNGLGNFSGNIEINLGFNNTSIAIGDFNNDGNQDLAVANQDNKVFIRLGDGLGGFSGNTEVSVGNFPIDIAIGDFNNDGNQDFAIANTNGNTVSIRLGDGLGGFSGTTEINVGNSPSRIVVGDFNNDGNQDLSITNTVGSTVSIRLGNGLGGFNGANEISVGTSPIGIAIGDFNNDGTQDFTTANAGNSTASIRLGSCSVTPTPTPTPTPTATPTATPTPTLTPTPTPVPEIDLRISQNDAPDPVTVGQPLTYTLTVFVRRFVGVGNVSPQIRFNFPSGVPFVFNSANGTNGYTATPDANGVTFSGGAFTAFGDETGTFNIIVTPQSAGTLTSLGSNAIVDPTNVVAEDNENNNTATTITTTVNTSNICTPTTTVTEGNLFPGGIVSFGVSSGAGSVTVDHVNAGTGLQSLTVVSSTNAVVNIPAFTPGTTAPIIVTFTPINPGLAVDFTLRAASTFHAANIRARCAEVCTPSTTVTEGDLFPGGIVSFGISSGAGSVTVDHVNAGTGTQSLTVVGTPINAVVNIPPFTIGTTMPIVVTFTPIDPNQPIDFTLRAASTFHAANVRVRCGTTPSSLRNK